VYVALSADPGVAAGGDGAGFGGTDLITDPGFEPV
jgi:hypothetical protein